MARHILRCVACGTYTLHDKCKCGEKAVQPIPPKYSPDDAYGKYRRQAKRDQLEKEGMI